MNTYEFIAILDLKKSTTKDIKELENLINKYTYKILYHETLGDKKLAYPIIKDNKEHTKGHFLLYKFETNDTESVKAFQKEISCKDNILKSIVVKM